MLVDVPEHYTLTQKEHVLLADLIGRQINRDYLGYFDPKRKALHPLREIQRKLALMDGYLHNVDMDLREVPEQKGKPPYPTDEKGSFKV